MIEVVLALLALVCVLAVAFGCVLKSLKKEKAMRYELEQYNARLLQQRAALQKAQGQNVQMRSEVEARIRTGERDYFESD